METSVGPQAAQQALDEQRRAASAIATEVRQAEPRWGWLTVGFYGPAIVAWNRLAGLDLVLALAACVLPTVIVLVVFNLRLRNRVQPRPVQRQDFRWKRTKAMWATDRSALALSFAPIILFGVAYGVAKSSGPLWLVLIASFAIATVAGLASQLLCTRAARCE